MTVVLTLEEGNYLDTVVDIFNFFGDLIYGFLLFVFFYVILGLPSRKSQCYVRIQVTDTGQQGSTYWKSLGAGFLIEKNSNDFNQLLEKIQDELDKYKDQAVNQISFSFTNIPLELFNRFAFDYRGYAPTRELLSLYLEELAQFAE